MEERREVGKIVYNKSRSIRTKVELLENPREGIPSLHKKKRMLKLLG